MPATLSDVAREVGVAPSTVADILRGRKGYSEKTRERTLAAAKKLDFVPNYFARSLQKQQSKTIGVLSDLGKTDMTGSMVNAITQGLIANGFMPFFAESGTRREVTERSIRELRSRLVDGLILDSCPNGDEMADILPDSFPCLHISCNPEAGPNVILADRYQAQCRAMRYLLELGHQRIAFLCTDARYQDLGPFNTLRMRIDGWLDVMREAGHYADDLLWTGPGRPGETRDFIASQGERLRSITAIFAGNDRIAMEIIAGIHQAGLRVPDDISVIGFNNSEFSEGAQPRLTTFDPQRQAIGVKAVELVLTLVAGEEIEPITFYPQLIERESLRSLS